MSDALAAKLSDRWWRINNLYQILTEDSKTVPLEMRSEQKEFLLHRANRNFVPKARKLGLSTIIVLDALDACLFAPDTRAGIIDLAAVDAYEKLEIARFAWERGPYHDRPEIATLWKILHKANPLVRDTVHVLKWKNGSQMSAGVSYTGKTPQRLHISEYGPISSQFPEKATKIKRGSINSVPPDGIVDIETTMEGGRFGECYLFFTLALASVSNDISKLDWKLHFFSWLNHPSYTLPGSKPARAETIEYFAKLEAKHGLVVPLERQAWYERKRMEQGEEMWQQFPTVIEEVDRQIVPHQIYPEMKRLRAEGRVANFNPEARLPMFAAFDLGSSDNMAGWLVQPAGKDHNILEWCAGEGAGAGGTAEVVRHWERKHSTEIQLLVPHDAELTDKGSGKTYVAQLVEAGIPRRAITVVPRIPDLWVGIDEVRLILPNCWFHASTDEPITDEEGVKLPSGVQRIEGYRKKLDKSTNIVRDMPVHDICSHTADALRTYAEALSNDLVRAHVKRPARRATVVKSGWRG